jgi:hypothetical protein
LLTDDARVVIYDRHVFIAQAIDQNFVIHAVQGDQKIVKEICPNLEKIAKMVAQDCKNI